MKQRLGVASQITRQSFDTHSRHLAENSPPRGPLAYTGLDTRVRELRIEQLAFLGQAGHSASKREALPILNRAGEAEAGRRAIDCREGPKEAEPTNVADAFSVTTSPYGELDLKFRVETAVISNQCQAGLPFNERRPEPCCISFDSAARSAL